MSRRRCKELAPLRAKPRDDAEQVTQALPGEPLAVEEERGDWVRVRTAYDYRGWLRADALGGEATEDWLVERDGDPVEEARAYLGVPYEWGGMTEHGIDCSGLVHMAYRRLGRLVPRDADQQEEVGTPVGPGGSCAAATSSATATTSPSGSVTAGSCTPRAARASKPWSRRNNRRSWPRASGGMSGSSTGLPARGTASPAETPSPAES
jgi:hypothetical protein